MYRIFTLSLSSISIPRDHHEAIRVPKWRQAMDEEMSALQSRETWDLVVALHDVEIVSCRWVFIIKYKPDGTIDRYKAHLVACEFT